MLYIMSLAILLNACVLWAKKETLVLSFALLSDVIASFLVRRSCFEFLLFSDLPLTAYVMEEVVMVRHQTRYDPAVCHPHGIFTGRYL